LSLTTYAGLKAAALRWVKRSGGTTVDDAMDDIVDLAEARLNRALRVAEMEASATVTLTSGVGALPTDYLEWREVWSGLNHHARSGAERLRIRRLQPGRVHDHRDGPVRLSGWGRP
jgi:hypothetical protein